LHYDTSSQSFTFYLHNEEFQNLSSSPDISWAGYVARVREMRNAYRVLMGKPEGKRALGKHRCR
jgi:hypothetical protein